MQLTAIKAFSWAHRHVEIREYAEGELIETDDQDLIEVSIREGWAADAAAPEEKPATTGKAGKQPKAAASAPEAAAEAGAPEVKAD